MTLGALRVSAIALGAAALVLSLAAPRGECGDRRSSPRARDSRARRVRPRTRTRSTTVPTTTFGAGHRYAYGIWLQPWRRGRCRGDWRHPWSGRGRAYDCGGYGYGPTAMDPVTTTATATGRTTVASATDIPVTAMARDMAATAAMAAAYGYGRGATARASPAATSATWRRPRRRSLRRRPLRRRRRALPLSARLA